MILIKNSKKVFSIVLSCVLALGTAIVPVGATANKGVTSIELNNNTVSNSNPAITVNVGETVDFSKYDVEFSNGTAAAASELSWKQIKEKETLTVITYRKPAVFATVGEKVDLTAFSVEFTEDTVTEANKITWKNTSGETITSVTPSLAGVEKIVAVSGGSEKNIYVVTKNPTDTEYVLYRNDFNNSEDIDDITREFGDAPATVDVSDGRLKITGTGYLSGNFTLPEWIGEFGDYKFKASMAIRALGKPGASAWFAQLVRVNGVSAYEAAIRQDANAANYSAWIWRRTGTAGSDVTNQSFVNGYTNDIPYGGGVLYTYTTDVKNNTISFYVNDTLLGTYSAATEHRTGTVGVRVNCLSLDVDYAQVTIEPTYEMIYKNGETISTDVTYRKPAIMADAGDIINLSACSVEFEEDVVTEGKDIVWKNSDGEVISVLETKAVGVEKIVAVSGESEKNIYVVTKNSADSEYVLYSNDFENAEDINDITTVLEGATLSVADDNLVVSAGSWQNSGFIFPEWISEFGDYKLESSISLTANTNGAGYVWLAQWVRANGKANYETAIRQNADTANYSVWIRQMNESYTEVNKVMTGAYTSDLSLGSYYTYTTEAIDDTIKFYVNNTLVQTYTNATAYRTGTVGIRTNCVSALVDYVKVTIEQNENVTTNLNSITEFTPQEAGVTQFVVTDKNGNEKNVYVLAKNLEDTEWVIYENNFDTADSISGITLGADSVAANLSVEDGKFKIDTRNNWGTAFLTMPDWIGDFGNYVIETQTTVTDQRDNSCWQGIIFRGQNKDANLRPYYLSYVKSNGNHWDAGALYFRNESTDWNQNFEILQYGKHDGYSLNNTYTHKLSVRDDIMEYVFGGKTVMYDNNEKLYNTGNVGFACIGSTVYMDYFKVTYLPAATTPEAPLSATYERTTDIIGMADGKMTVTLDSNTTAEDVVVYWGDSDAKKLGGYEYIVKRRVTGNVTNLSFDIAENCFIPEGAEYLLVYTNNTCSESENAVKIKLPINRGSLQSGELLYTFQVVSDTHINGKENHVNTTNFKTFLENVAKNDPDSKGIIIGGDVVDNGTTAQYDLFKKIWNSVDGLPQLYAVIGNHEFWTVDYAATMTNFETAIKDLGGVTSTADHFSQKITADNGTEYTYLFLSPAELNEFATSSSPSVATISEEQLTWLDTELSAQTENKPTFVFLHQPMYNTVAGTIGSQTGSGVTNHEDLKAVLAKYPNAILFTSHSHWTLNADKNMYKADNSLCNVFNTAATSYIVDDYYVERGVSVSAAQGYYVEVYSDKVLVRGKNLLTDEWMPNTQFVVFYDEPELWPEDVPTLSASESIRTEEFSFNIGSQNISVLENKFALYYNREGIYNKRTLASNGDSAEATSWINLWNYWMQRDETMGWGEHFRKIDSLVPLNSLNKEVMLANFETSYDIRFEGNDGGVILGFRQKTPGKFTDNYQVINTEQAFVAIGQNGITISGGNSITNEMYNAWTTEDFEEALPQEVTVNIKAVGEQCQVLIYERATGTLLKSYDVTIPYTKAGYIAYGVSAIRHDIANIKLTALDNNGEVTDIAVAQSSSATVLNYYGGSIDVMGKAVDGSYEYTLQVNPYDNYQLKTGSLYLKDSVGNTSVPVISGDTYTLKAVTGGTLYAEFIPTDTAELNTGILAAIPDTVKNSIRFMHRANITNEADGLYTILSGEKVKVSDFGLLVAYENALGTNELNLDNILTDSRIRKYSVSDNSVYYKEYDSFIDYGFDVKCLDLAKDGTDKNIVTRTYALLSDGSVVYGDIAISSYSNSVSANYKFVDEYILGEKVLETDVRYLLYEVGDVNCDETVDAGDLVSLRKVLLNTEENVWEISADVHTDNKVDLKDLVGLKKKFAK